MTQFLDYGAGSPKLGINTHTDTHIDIKFLFIVLYSYRKLSYLFVCSEPNFFFHYSLQKLQK